MTFTQCNGGRLNLVCYTLQITADPIEKRESGLINLADITSGEPLNIFILTRSSKNWIVLAYRLSFDISPNFGALNFRGFMLKYCLIDENAYSYLLVTGAVVAEASRAASGRCDEPVCGDAAGRVEVLLVDGRVGGGEGLQGEGTSINDVTL